ncbi:predicted protein [Naegleria gruberi]|uniref:Predicted protein n=1 Tax=Naegleria gruberi TaxID=5762 RepID=D2W308_NAEGR|nr:uncharacterized protein NAEGRDRAFT_59977 [Naegleria gruberi]EFC36500.1 predicted protein [Naegleria gruberi]|eukprot:XP_002669244.1 predicted protein [Naegleria gruberi strain NEG-M]
MHHQPILTSPSIESSSSSSSSHQQHHNRQNDQPTANIRVMLTGIVPNCLLGRSLTINLLPNGHNSSSNGMKDLIAKYLNETTVKHFKLEILQNLLEQAEKDFGGIENGAKYASVSTFVSHAKLLDFKLIKMGFLMENERSLNYYVKYQTSTVMNDAMTIISLHAVFQDYADLMIMVEEKLQHELHNTQESLYHDSFTMEKRGGLLDEDARESVDIEQNIRENTTPRGCCTIL